MTSLLQTATRLLPRELNVPGFPACRSSILEIMYPALVVADLQKLSIPRAISTCVTFTSVPWHNGIQSRLARKSATQL